MERTRILLDAPSDAPALGFHTTAIALATLIEGSEPRFAVGIFGGWGSGKTTLMDAIHRELNRTDTLKVRFNAWRYERESHLVIPLLDTIRGALTEYAAGQEPALRAKVMDIARAVGAVVRALVSSVSAELSVGVAKLTVDGGKATDQLTAVFDPAEAPPESLYFTCFQRLDEAFTRLHETGIARIVVFVDDLDRCLPANALDVIESMKLFFDLRGFVFVAGIDQVALEQAVRVRIAGGAQTDGATAATRLRTRIAEREYVKKIFQVPYELAPMAPEQLDELLDCIYRTAELGTVQLADLRGRVRPFLSHIAVDNHVNPREVKRFINAYTLQTLVRPQLDRDAVLAVQTLAFRDDWPLFDIMRTDTDAFPGAIERYRSGEDSALSNLWPDLGALPTDLALFLRSAQGAALERTDLRAYVTSVETTVVIEPWLNEAYSAVGGMRRVTRSLPTLLGLDTAARDLDRAARDLNDLIAMLAAAISDVGGSERLTSRTDALRGVVRKLHTSMSREVIDEWVRQSEQAIADIQRELRILRATPIRAVGPANT